MATPFAAGEELQLAFDLEAQLHEIGRQIHQKVGYPFDPNQLRIHLQRAIEGKFGEIIIQTAPTPTAWKVDDEGNIHFTLTSNGFSPQQWEQHLERRGWRISDYARQVLRRASEAPTNGVTYNIVVCQGKLISDSDRITKKIRAAADKKGWLKPHWEVACLIRDTFTDEQLEQMGLWYIVTMHEPIKDSDGDPYLLRSDRDDVGRRLCAHYDRPGDGWRDVGGFAFAVPQVGPQT